MTRRVRRVEPETEPWLRPDVQQNRIASADVGENHPGICYEFGDPNSEPFIPNNVIKAAVNQREFVVALWQQDTITTILMSREPGDTNKNGWCDVVHYKIRFRNPIITSVVETEPEVVMPELLNALCTPLGHTIEDGRRELLPSNDPILRVVFEFPDAVETERLPLDTSIAALGAIAHKSYSDTIYGSRTV